MLQPASVQLIVIVSLVKGHTATLSIKLAVGAIVSDCTINVGKLLQDHEVQNLSKEDTFQ